MSGRIPAPGTILRGEDGVAIVVALETTPVTALLDMIEEGYGGERFSEDNTAVLAAVPSVKIETWRSCTKAWRESENVEDEYVDDWWAPNGDGARQIRVAWYPGSVYSLGDDADVAEQVAPS